MDGDCLAALILGSTPTYVMPESMACMKQVSSSCCQRMCGDCSTIVKKAASTISLGFGIFIVAWILLLVIGFGVPYHASYNVGLQVIFSLFPWSLLAKGIQDLAAAAAGEISEGRSCTVRAHHRW